MSNTEWKKVKLGDIGKLTMGSTPSTKVAEYYGGDRLWITPSDIVKGNKYVYETERKLTDLGWSEARHIPANSILITCIASIGKNCIATEEVSCNQQIIALTPSEDYDVHYLYYAICSIENQLHSIAGKATVEIVNKTKLSSIGIDVPSLEEQRRIASLLSRFDELIQLHELKADNLIKAKQQIMSDIFSGGLRELDSINPDDYVQDNWVTVKLGDIFNIKAGGDIDKQLVVEEPDNYHKYPVIANGLTNHGILGYTDTYKFAGKTITVTGRGDIGKAEYRDYPFYPVVRLLVLTPKVANVDLKFISYIINTMEFASESTGVPQLTTKKIAIRSIKIPPTIEEQQKIANLLSSYDGLVELKRSQKQQVTNMKQQLMNQLLNNGGGAKQLGNC